VRADHIAVVARCGRTNDGAARLRGRRTPLDGKPMRFST
jgi:hypothetical protein